MTTRLVLPHTLQFFEVSVLPLSCIWPHLNFQINLKSAVIDYNIIRCFIVPIWFTPISDLNVFGNVCDHLENVLQIYSLLRLLSMNWKRVHGFTKIVFCVKMCFV